MIRAKLSPQRRYFFVVALLVTALSLSFILVTHTSVFASISEFIQTAKLNASDGAANDSFGRSVAVSDDITVIGANQKDGKGAAYVYERNGNTWTQTAKLSPDELDEGDLFGIDVAISGDVIAVGARGDDDNVRGGAGYVFEKVGGVWTQTAKLTAATAQWMGHSIAIDGETIVVGAVFSTVVDNDYQGDAYVFEKRGGVWTQTARLFASDGGVEDTFGQAVAVDGTRIVVGSDWHDAAGEDAGGAWVYEKIGGVWTETAKLQSSDIAAGDSFGVKVVVEETTIVISAYGDENAGSAYVFDYEKGKWVETAELVPSDGEPEDYAYYVSYSGDRIVLGGRNHNALGEKSGAVWTFERSGGIWSETNKLMADDGSANDYFGMVAISGDIIVVGASGDDDLGENSGSIYVYEVETFGIWLPLVTH